MQERRDALLHGIVEGYSLRKVCLCRGYRTQVEQGPPQDSMRHHEHGSVLRLLRQGQELFAQGVCRLHLGARSIIVPQSPHYWKKLLRIVEVFTEMLSTEIGLSDFRSPSAFGGKQRCP